MRLVTAQRLAGLGGEVAVVTHDVLLAKAAGALGFVVVDPVTDNPGRGPVG
jgi:hypothetical protein